MRKFKLKPSVSGVSVGGVPYAADTTGHITVEDEHVHELLVNDLVEEPDDDYVVPEPEPEPQEPEPATEPAEPAPTPEEVKAAEAAAILADLEASGKKLEY